MKITNFKTVLAAALSALALFVSGCVATGTGQHTAGVPFLKDTITAQYQRSVEQLVAATRIVLARNGKLSVDNSVDNSFQVKINERDVWVKITKVDDKVTELKVQARTRMGADLPLAAQLDKEIALQLTVTP